MKIYRISNEKSVYICEKCGRIVEDTNCLAHETYDCSRSITISEASDFKEFIRMLLDGEVENVDDYIEKIKKQQKEKEEFASNCILFRR